MALVFGQGSGQRGFNGNKSASCPILRLAQLQRTPTRATLEAVTKSSLLRTHTPAPLPGWRRLHRLCIFLMPPTALDKCQPGSVLDSRRCLSHLPRCPETERKPLPASWCSRHVAAMHAGHGPVCCRGLGGSVSSPANDSSRWAAGCQGPVVKSSPPLPVCRRPVITPGTPRESKGFCLSPSLSTTA